MNKKIVKKKSRKPYRKRGKSVVNIRRGEWRKLRPAKKTNLALFRKKGWIESLKLIGKVIIKDIMESDGVGIKKAVEIAKKADIKPTKIFVIEGRKYFTNYYLQYRFGDRKIYFYASSQKIVGSARAYGKQSRRKNIIK